jgi:hypothetical protein
VRDFYANAGIKVCDATRRRWNVTALAPARFEVERFELAGDARIEVRGRWSGVRGRRFMRPTLTGVAGGREQRILAVLDDKPWIAEEGEIWRAAFPCSTDPAALRDAELTVAPDVTVPLAPPSAPGPAEALGARDAALAERHDAIEAEVALRIADLRAEAERERAGARLAAQTARERDAARAARDEAARERDAARSERDSAVQERNRMLAERDTAKSRIEELARQWELTAALGTRRTLERDTVTVERERLARDRDAVLEERDRLACDHDVVLEERDRLARDHDVVLEERDRTASERDAALAELDSASHQATISLVPVEETREWRPLVPKETIEWRPPAPKETIEWHPPAPSDHDVGSPDLQTRWSEGESSKAWRARVLALSALLLAAIVLLVLVLAK